MCSFVWHFFFSLFAFVVLVFVVFFAEEMAKEEEGMVVVVVGGTIVSSGKPGSPCAVGVEGGRGMSIVSFLCRRRRRRRRGDIQRIAHVRFFFFYFFVFLLWLVLCGRSLSLDPRHPIHDMNDHAEHPSSNHFHNLIPIRNVIPRDNRIKVFVFVKDRNRKIGRHQWGGEGGR